MEVQRGASPSGNEQVINILIAALGLALVGAALFALSFLISSIHERERRASLLSGLTFAALTVLTAAFVIGALSGFFYHVVGLWLLIIALAAIVALVLLLALPIGANPMALQGTRGLIVGEVKRHDERTVVFSAVREALARRLLGPEAPSNGDERLADALMNRLGAEPLKCAVLPEPGRIDGDTGAAVVAMADASDAIVDRLAFEVDHPPADGKLPVSLSPDEAALRVKGFARQLGAVLVGICELDRRWLYSHRGSGGLQAGQWGAEVNLDHTHAVVFAVEMDPLIVAAAPHSPVLEETMRCYAQGAHIAAQLAGFIAELGYHARSNQDSRYDALMVPLAVDAGLGELSRMGYLITRDFGPRVRLGAVTTDLPLTADRPVDLGVAHFCSVCRKCARCCPSGAIPSGEKHEHNGSLRWKLNAEACLSYWREVGTDCAVCMRVCPFSHVRTLSHRLVSELAIRNAPARRLLSWLDDLFYGATPGPKAPPAWAALRRDGRDAVAGD